jgi:hypothetical protein
VQLAPCSGDNYGLFAGDNIREAQRRSSLSIPDAHLIVLNDLGDAGEMINGSWNCRNPSAPTKPPAPQTHPKNKTEPGRRLGLQVWRRLFGNLHSTSQSTRRVAGTETVATAVTMVTTGPVFQSAVKSGTDTLVVQFEAASSAGLHWAPTHNCSCYTLSAPCCSTDTQYVQLSNLTMPDDQSSQKNNKTRAQSWVNASATITGSTLIAPIPADFDVKWIRFQYVAQPICVLANSDGLPTSLFLAPVGTGAGSWS